MLLVAMAAGCRAVATVSLPDREVGLPADVTAAIVAGAVREALPCEGVAAACGVPVMLRDDGSFRIELTGDPHGRWLARADHRLRIVLPPRCCRAVVDHQTLPAAERLHGFGGATRSLIRLDIAPAAAGTKLSLAIPAQLRANLCRHIDRALALATSLEGAGPGITEPNLAAWRLAALLQAALGTADAARRADLLSRATRLPNTPAFVHGELADIAIASGDQLRAQQHLQFAACSTSDPRERAQFAARAAGLALEHGDPERLRDRAFVHLVTGRLETAERLVHSASREQRQPVFDYRLLGQIHQRLGDLDAAQAAELLAREYAADLGEPSAADATALLQLPTGLRRAPRPDGR